mmetsp:Transcript_6739/g.16180  ORF Transcript_6739/g.16180 Transcript_6739/m.16180 type:complete len:308 (+) Transcript_6739:178-1101(+)
MLWLEAEQLLGLVRRHKEGRVAEGEEALGNLHARLGVVGGHLHVGHPRRRAAQLRQLHVRDEVGGATVEDLTHRLAVADGGGDHGRVVRSVREADKLRAITRHKHGPAAACAIEEGGKVALALLGSVDVLRPEAAEGQALLAQQLLRLPLPARLDSARLSDRTELTLGGRIHARAADVGVVLDAPRRRRVRVRRDVLRALGPVVDHRAERGAAQRTEAGGGVLEVIAPDHLDARSIEVAVRVVRRLALVRALVQHRHLHALFLDELQSEVVADLAVAAALVLDDERRVACSHARHTAARGRAAAQRE